MIDDDEFDDDIDEILVAAADRVRMALTEAGYPDADVYVEPGGVFVDGVPDEVRARAFQIADF